MTDCYVVNIKQSKVAMVTLFVSQIHPATLASLTIEVMELAEADMTEGSLQTEDGDATRAMAAAAAAAAAVTPPPPPATPPAAPSAAPLVPLAAETAAAAAAAAESGSDVGTKEDENAERFGDG